MREQSKTATGLSQTKRELLALMLKQKGVCATGPEAISRRGDDRPCVLSFAQERVWFFEQLEPGSAVYNVPAVVRLSGQLNPQVLEWSLSEIARRHESLRTTFSMIEGTPVQRIAPPPELRLPVVDLRGLPHAAREQRAREIAGHETRRPFNLATGPLLRALLIRLADQEHVAVLTMHHITADGWSTMLLVRELSALYRAFSAGEPSPLSELPIQYADFAIWQRRWLSGETLDVHLAYWKRQLADLPVVKLPTDRPRPLMQSYRGARQTLVLDRPLTQKIKALSTSEDATLFMTLLAAWQTLIYRYTWQPDIVVGSPIANRTRLEIEPLIGFFVNTLVLRTKIEDNPRFIQFLRHVKEVTLGAYAHQSLPFEKLVDELAPERELGRHPLFQIFFALNNNPGETLELPGLKLGGVAAQEVMSKFDLEMSLIELEEGIQATLIYSTDLFEAATIERLLKHYEGLLQGIVLEPDARLLDLPFPGDAPADDAPTLPAFQNFGQFVFDL
jgi:aspartate racemase